MIFRTVVKRLAVLVCGLGGHDFIEMRGWHIPAGGDMHYCVIRTCKVCRFADMYSAECPVSEDPDSKRIVEWIGDVVK